MKINLQKNFFSKSKSIFATHGEFIIESFQYASGVEALKIKNSKCSFIFTPFKGQQIWNFKVGETELSMQTTIKEPQSSTVYLENYGGFLYHCGIISFGASDKKHPQHGELPNAEYDNAYIDFGEDTQGKYICLGGEINHDTAFTRKYRFSPEITIYENSSLFNINIKIENLRCYPMEYMYLCHINFRPIDGAKLICSAKYDKEHIKIYKTDGSKELCQYFKRLEDNLHVMNSVGDDGQCYDPEICFGIKYEYDERGRAYTLQCTEDGSCYVSHPADILTNGVRWISRTANEDAMGMVLPATAEHLGYEHARANGQLKIMAPNETLEFNIEAGYIDQASTEKIKKKISDILLSANTKFQ